VDLVLRDAAERTELGQRVAQTVVINLLVAGAIVLLLVVMGNRVTRPLQDIRKSLDRLAEGDTDIELSGVYRTDQVGRLSRAVFQFRNVLQRLRSTEAQLLQLNSGLEAAVAERTGHLQRAMDRVRASEMHLQSIIDTALDAVILTNPSGHVKGWNQRATLLLGWTALQAQGLPLADLLVPQDEDGRPPAALGNPQTGALPWHAQALRMEVTVVRASGARVPVEWAMGPLGVPGAPDGEVCVFLRDISQRRRVEEDQRHALARKAELFELRSRFIALTSHEFRTPLTAILSSVELLHHYRGRMSDDEQNALLQAVETGVLRLTAMLDRVLVIGQADAEQLEFSPRETPMADLCHTIAIEARAAHGPTAPELVEDYAQGDGVGRVDGILVRHMLVNLLSNAFVYSPAGEAVGLTLSQSEREWIIEVSDHGTGIALADVPHLFDSFFRGGNVGHAPGSGLGLAIVERAARLHGASVDVASVPGQGSTFTLRLPKPLAATG
jgi:PAS domain S-box-containing protein